MKTETIEYLRYDDLKTGILSEGKAYIMSVGKKNALTQVKTPEHHLNLSKKLRDALTYKKGVTPAHKSEVIKELSASISPFFVAVTDISEDVDHLEVFLNPSELALLPFELLLDANGAPRFISKSGVGQVLTRNDRRAINMDQKIPENPRVLFAYVTPNYSKSGVLFKEVPYKDHAGSFKRALKYRGGDDQLTPLKNPTFKEFKATILKAADNKNPFTHIHLLAHGFLLIDMNNPIESEFGIAFNAETENPKEYKATSAVLMKSVFDELSPKDLPYLVNYMICDGANFSNGILPDKNPLQVTFNAGVPVVIGSQFPLSMEGSNRITKTLYQRLFRGDDVREILMDIRTDLYDDKPHPDSHDWISLISYINLPASYDYQLLSHKTKCQLNILNSIRDGANQEVLSEDDFKVVKFQIKESIKVLNAELNGIEKERSKEKEFLEYAGLLGSSFKRLAEVEFKEGDFQGSDTKLLQLEYLKKAKNWYQKAAEKNRSHHWSIVQYLSLKTILEGHLDEDDLDLWYAARGAARNEIKQNSANATWPYGTLIELYLLNPDTSDAAHESKILNFAGALVENAKPDKTEHIKSTYLQIERYLKWWNGSNFKLTNTILANDQLFIAKLVETLEV